MAKKLSGKRGAGRGKGQKGNRAEDSRAAIERSILELSGERGYANLTMAELLKRAGSNRSRFYATWTGKEDCFASAYGRAAGELEDRLLGAGGTDVDWDTGLAAALVELADFTAESPELAVGLMGEVRVAGGPALRKHDQVLGRLTGALERGRREPRVIAPPPATARFVLRAIEAAALRNVVRRTRLVEDLPDLLFLALVYYRGPAAARRAAARLAAGAWP
ncbi:MAG TPA: TetR/AcrR family transcriptional regulator [Solirubrobacterales bacterium]|nr:TetR/AcrR family transcriptional regulator [Solirubrobacterales bacterium]